MRKQGKRFTVIFYIDGDSNVETFCEHVRAANSGDAFDSAVRKARREHNRVGGDFLPWHNATEICTFAGHLESA